MELTFCDLKGKEVINIIDGKKLGKVIDLVFETTSGRVLGFIVPPYNKGFNLFKTADDIFIPSNNVCKIGDDAMLVKIYVPVSTKTQKKKSNCHAQSVGSQSFNKERKNQGMSETNCDQYSIYDSLPIFPNGNNIDDKPDDNKSVN